MDTAEFTVGPEVGNHRLNRHAMGIAALHPSYELIVKFWPPSVTARGVVAIKAVERPRAFAVYSRPFVAIALALIFGWQVVLPGVGFLKRVAGL